MINLNALMTDNATAATRLEGWQAHEATALEMISDQFPHWHRGLAESDRVAVVRLAYKNAIAAHVVTGADHLKYLVPVLHWGSYFQSDPQFSADLAGAGWHNAAPYRPSFGALADRIDRHTAEVASDTASYARFMDALGAVYRHDWSRVDHKAAVQAARHVWPTRSARLGRDGLHESVGHCGQIAAQSGLNGADQVVHIVLSLYFGHRFAEDPLYPWAVRAFQQSSETAFRHELLSGVRQFFDLRIVPVRDVT